MQNTDKQKRIASGDQLDAAGLDRDRVSGVSLGRPIRCLDSCGSTNREAKLWAEADAPHGAADNADAQTDGRGRTGRN